MARAAGAAFEKALDRTHEAYARYGIAQIEQLPVPTIYVGAGLRRAVSNQGYDYAGRFGPNAGPRVHVQAYHGASICMEAKYSAAKTSMPVVASTRSSGISIHQLTALVVAYRDFGAVSSLVWMNGDRLLVATPDVLAEALAKYETGERKSIPEGVFAGADIVDYPDARGVHDWLYTVRLWLEANGLPSAAISSRRQYEMIGYALNTTAKTISVVIKGEKVTVETPTCDRSFLDALAKEAANATEFLERLKRVEPANEDRSHAG